MPYPEYRGERIGGGLSELCLRTTDTATCNQSVAVALSFGCKVLFFNGNHASLGQGNKKPAA